MWSATKGASIGLIPGRRTIGPLFLMVSTPIFALVVWYTYAKLDGDVMKLFHHFRQHGFIDGLRPVFTRPEMRDWQILGVYALIELVLMKIPAKTFTGPVTPTGHVPVYEDNAKIAYVVSLVLYVGGAYLNIFNPAEIYDRFGSLQVASTIFGLLFCVMLYIKGRFFPSTQDCGTTGNIVFDYYWGTELYPRIWGIDLKRFTNCRFGMMAWPLVLISYAAKQYQIHGYFSDSMLVALGIQFVYLTKFFVWEQGYLSSIDIMHDHAGFYICWGCLCWVPLMYTSATMYLVKDPVHLGPVVAILMFVAGSACVLANFAADAQRQDFRARNGDVLVWGKAPNYIVAHYTTEKGEKKQSLLLASGWWGIARHFHYVPEILGAFFWCLPALGGSPLPYFYPAFLCILLSDRAFRDDARCQAKYGKDWDKYCSLVPYKIVPRIV